MSIINDLLWEFLAITIMVLVVVGLGKIFAYFFKRKMGE
ncbi:hypothetical protein NitYY0918_C1204 [Nitratiruptor sp. YY09-18]|nr:hypothetical protein NitYY0918_C1204 [Nitratiruptor sp. YY09-18]